jgi:hypothetical protein
MRPVTEPNELANLACFWQARSGVLAVVAGAAALAALAACDLPFNLSQPSTRALQEGAVSSLSTSSFEIKGSYTGPGYASPQSHASGARTVAPAAASETWSIDLQLVSPSTLHAVVAGGDVKVEAIVIGANGYFRGQQFLADHMGSDALSLNFVRAAGNAWWKGSAGLAPQLPDFTNGSVFKATFLGAAATSRTDHVSVDGMDAVDMSGPRADVYIATAPPYALLRVALKNGASIDGITNADFRYLNFAHDFGIAAPNGVIDFSNLSSLPPIYTVLSVDTSGCSSPCAVSAEVKNLGGTVGAKAPSTVTFTMTSNSTGKVLGTCSAQVVPDVPYNVTTKVGCTISLSGPPANATLVTATADNPGHA